MIEQFKFRQCPITLCNFDMGDCKNSESFQERKGENVPYRVP